MTHIKSSSFLKFFVKFILSQGILLSIFSCGEHKKTDSQERDFTPGEIQTDCKINGKNLEKFFEKIVTDDITCLGKSLKLFVRVVAPKSPEFAGYLSREILERYVKQDPTLTDLVANLKYFGLFFEISNLIFADTDNPDYLNSIRIDDLTNFFITINANAIVMNELLKEGKKIYRETLTESERLRTYNIYMENKSKLNIHTENISKELLKLFSKGRKRYISTLDLEKIFDTFGGNFSIYKSLLFVKKIIAGGDPKSISQKELSYLVKVAPDLLSFFYDVSHFGEVVFVSQADQYNFYHDIIRSLQRILYYAEGTDEEKELELFTVADLAQGLQEVSKLIKDVDQKDKYEKLIKKIIPLLPELKSLLMKEVIGETGSGTLSFGPERSEESFTTNNFIQLIKFANKVVDTATGFSKLFYANKNILVSTKKISPSDLVAVDGITQEVLERFIRIVSEYRFFKGEERVPIIGNSFMRTESGVVELGIFEKIYEHVALHYEIEAPCDDKKLIMKRPQNKPSQPLNKCYGQKNGENEEDYRATLSQGQLEYVINKLKKPLNDIGLVIIGREFIAAENATLLTDLFQVQSNGSSLISAREAVEFALQVIASLNVKDDLLQGIKVAGCTPLNLKVKRIVDYNYETNQYSSELVDKVGHELGCSRDAFVTILSMPFTRYLDKSDNKVKSAPSDSFTFNPSSMVMIKERYKLENSLQRFSKFIKDSNSKTIEEFIRAMERFTRTCYDEDLKKNYQRPYLDVDLIGIFAGLFNIESTLVRFDYNKDNILAGKEVEDTYQHFKKPLSVILNQKLKGKLPGIQKILLEPLFYFLINELRVPTLKFNEFGKLIGDISKLIGYSLKLKKHRKESRINQITIATILAQLKIDSPNKMTDAEIVEYCSNYAQ